MPLSVRRSESQLGHQRDGSGWGQVGSAPQFSLLDMTFYLYLEARGKVDFGGARGAGELLGFQNLLFKRRRPRAS